MYRLALLVGVVVKELEGIFFTFTTNFYVFMFAGREVNSVEIQATVFTVPSYICFWELLDIKRNFYGWYYDSYYYEYCVNKVKGGLVC